MKTILVIDDDETILDICAFSLQDAGYRVIKSQVGIEGVELARRHLPDIVLTDIAMPGTDGIDVLKQLREDGEVAAKQIVLMTGNAHTINVRTAMELGADDFLVKPFTAEELLRCVEARLQRAQVHWRIGAKAVTDLRASLRSTLPHEFFTPLAGMLGLVEVLRGDLKQLSPADLTELLDGIELSGWRLHRTLKNYLAIHELEDQNPALGRNSMPLSAEQIQYAINAGIEAAIKRFKREKDLIKEVQPCQLLGNAADIATLVEELVDNACAFSRPGTPIQVQLNTSGILTVTDSGRGMTNEEVEQIGVFRQFDRRRYEQQGLGLGLTLVRLLAEKCGATFTLETQPGSGTIARVKFTALTD